MLAMLHRFFDQKHVLFVMGSALVLIQLTETGLRCLLTYAIQKQPLTLEALEAQQAFERKKTIGYFLAELRKRVDVHPAFDAVLSEFLEKRNTFIHNISNIEGWCLTTREGREVAHRFLNRLLHLNQAVTNVTSGVLRAWQQQVGYDIPIPPGGEELFRRLDQQVVPFLDALFREKADS